MSVPIDLALRRHNGGAATRQASRVATVALAALLAVLGQVMAAARGVPRQARQPLPSR